MVKITMEIPDNKLDDFKLGFLKAYPKEGAITDIMHVKQFLKLQLFNYYMTGKILIAQETTDPEIDEQIIED
jgi:hypothetical protein